MELHLKLRPTDGEPLPDPTRYRQLVGGLGIRSNQGVIPLSASHSYVKYPRSWDETLLLRCCFFGLGGWGFSKRPNFFSCSQSLSGLREEDGAIELEDLLVEIQGLRAQFGENQIIEALNTHVSKNFSMLGNSF